MDALRQDDLDSAKESSAKERLGLALEMMDHGLELKRQNLRRAHPDASDEELERAYQAWLFSCD